MRLLLDRWVFLSIAALLLVASADAQAQPSDPLLSGPILYGADDWSFHPVLGTQCRDGSTTGIAVRMVPGATKLVITMEGGGACFSGVTCLGNPGTYGATQFYDDANGLLGRGIWDRSKTQNDLADYSQVFIPYCTGDLHAGDRVANVPGVIGTQRYVGYNNSRLDFEYIVQRLLPDLGADPEVMLTGYSAGAFGALFNASQLHALLPTSARMTVLNDSAPPFDDALFQSCQQQRWWDTWGLANTLGATCGASCGASNWVNPFFDRFLVNYPEVGFSLLSSTNDSVIQSFMWFFAAIGCGIDPSEAEYRAGLVRLRDQMHLRRFWQQNTGSYYLPNSADHTYIQENRYYTTSKYGVALQTWLEIQFSHTAFGIPVPPVYLDVGP